MSRHASLEELASFIEGTLRARKTSRIASHLTGCTMCTGHVHELRRVSVVLASASVSFPGISPQHSARIELALAAESVTRVSAGPAAARPSADEPLSAAPASGEASRRDLPTRARPPRRRWRMPGLSSPLAGSLAAVGAAVVIAGGGYLVASHLGPAQTTSSSNSGSGGASAARPPAASSGHAAAGAASSAGPEVQFREHGVIHSIRAVQTNTHFTASGLRAQALTEMNVASKTNIRSATGALTSPGAFPTNGGTFSRENATQLSGCVSKIAHGRNVLLVDIAYYQDKPATIIAVGASPAGPGTVYVVSSGCSASHADIIAQQPLPKRSG